MLTTRVLQAASRAPLALVVFEDESMSGRITTSLLARGYRTFAIDSMCGDSESLHGLRPDVIVLDIRRNLHRVTRTLVELSMRSNSPPVVLVADGDDTLWIASRFGLLTISENAQTSELLSTVDRARREQRRPKAPA